MPFGTARYGATILGYTNFSPCTITVDKTQFFTVGDRVRVANVVSSFTGPSLNGEYLISSLTPNTIVIDADTSLFGTYISGGYVTVLEQFNPKQPPNLQSNFVQPFIPWVVFNQSIGSQVQSVF